MRDMTCIHNIIYRDLIHEYLHPADRGENTLYRAFSRVLEMRDMACIHIIIDRDVVREYIRLRHPDCDENMLHRAF